MAYSGPKIKANQCMFVLYPESQQANIEYAQTNFPCAWALHDKDVWQQSDVDKWNRAHSELPFPHEVGSLKKPHVHFVCKFPNSGRYFHAIAKELGVPPSTINRCTNLYKAYQYLTHKNDPDKYQYDESIVGTHEFDVPTEGNGSASEEEAQVAVLLEMPDFATTAECARWAYENGCWAAFRKGYGIWRDIRAEMHRSKEPPQYRSSQQNPDHPDFANPYRPVVNTSPWGE